MYVYTLKYLLGLFDSGTDQSLFMGEMDCFEFFSEVQYVPQLV